MKRISFCIAAVMVVGATVAATASAHFGQITADCNKVTFSFTSFPAQGSNSVNEHVSVDGKPLPVSPYVFTGSSSSNNVALNLANTGNHVVVASSDWTEAGGSSAGPVTFNLVCGSAPMLPTCPAGTTPTSSGPGYVVCNTTTTVTNTIWGTGTCPAGTTQTSTGLGFVVCNTTNTVTVPGPTVTKIVYKKSPPKIIRRTVVKWKTRVVNHYVPVRAGCHYVPGKHSKKGKVVCTPTAYTP